MNRTTTMRGVLAGCCLVAANVAGADVDASDERAERLAFAARPGFDGYANDGRQDGLLRQARAAWSHGDVDEAYAKLSELIDGFPPSIVGHLAMTEVTAKRAELAIDDTARAKWRAESAGHRAKADRLIDSIVGTTRCLSMEDDCKVIGIGEENQVIRRLGGGTKVKQALLIGKERTPFDAITVRDAAGDTIVYYFDIAPFFHAFDAAATKWP